MPRSQTPSVDSHRLLAGVWSPVCHQALLDRAVHQRNHWWQWLQKSSCPSSGPQHVYQIRHWWRWRWQHVHQIRHWWRWQHPSCPLHVHEIRHWWRWRWHHVHQIRHWWRWRWQQSSCPSSGPQELHALALSSQGPKSDQLIGLSLPPRHHQRQQLGPCKGQLDDRLHLASQGIAGEAATPQIDSARGVHIGLLCGADLHRRLRHLNMNVVVVQAQVSHGLREELQAQAQANQGSTGGSNRAARRGRCGLRGWLGRKQCGF